MSILALALLTLTAAENKVSAELIADAQSMEPGATFRTGVLFRLPENAHIYWRNPGGSGLATGVEWDLPQGVTVGELQWPNPIQFNTPGLDDVSYGYTGEILLFAQFAVDEAVDVSALSIAARAYWLLCEDDGTCIPEETTVALELSVGESESNDTAEELFDRFAARVPGLYESFDQLRHTQPLLLDEPAGLMLYAQPPWQFVPESQDGIQSRFFPETGSGWAFHMDLTGTDEDVPDDPRVLTYRPSDFIQFYADQEIEKPVRGVLTLPMENAESKARAVIYAVVPGGLLPHP